MSYSKKYKSHLGAQGLITAPNYLAEFILIRHAENRGIKLPSKIWSKKLYGSSLQWKYWYGLYHGELTRAYRLLKKYKLNYVLKALQTGEGKVILSLQNNKISRLTKEICEQEKKIEQYKERVELNIVKPNTLPRSSRSNKSKLGKLK
jgi:hypothetical protein